MQEPLHPLCLIYHSPGEDSVMPEQPRLLEQVRDLIRLKHYSLRTEEAYLKTLEVTQLG